MVPKVAKSGASFKGAALYYLHDKQANTNERVAFTVTVNLPTDDPDRAVAHMVDTAEHAHELKQAAGLKAGRKLKKPVYAYSLAWHPTEAPTKAEQIDAAKQTLAVLGLSDRQALIVAHTDREHPHVHVIVNRVCPETGRAAVTSQDRLKLSRWAEATTASCRPLASAPSKARRMPWSPAPVLWSTRAVSPLARCSSKMRLALSFLF